MMKRFITFFPFTVALAIGCGNSSIRFFNESLVDTAIALCSCSSLDYESEEECRAEFPPDKTEQACVEALFESLEQDFRPHLECRVEANNHYTECLNSKTCTDLERVGFYAQWVDEEAACPNFPSEVQKDLSECLN